MNFRISLSSASTCSSVWGLSRIREMVWRASSTRPALASHLGLSGSQMQRTRTTPEKGIWQATYFKMERLANDRSRYRRGNGMEKREYTYRKSPLEGAMSKECCQAQPARDGNACRNQEGLHHEKRTTVTSRERLGLEDGNGDSAETDSYATDDASNEPEDIVKSTSDQFDLLADRNSHLSVRVGGCLNHRADDD